MVRLLALLFALAFGMPGPAAAEFRLVPEGADGGRRIALVIGNGQYRAVGALPNPVADAMLMKQTLEGAGFTVTLLADADQATMKQGIADFGRSLRAAGPDTVALFYYAGHAVQSFGNNYLLPVDSAIRDEADLDLVGVEAGWVLRQLFSARVRTNIVILDACRNNPFPEVAGFTDKGLAEMNAPTGSFIAYATAPGSVALDGTGGNSPYTRALADEIAGDPDTIENIFKRVRIRVLNETNGAQTPWESSSLTSDFYFRAPAGPGGSATDEAALWESVKDGSDPVKLQLYLWAFPQGSHRTEAEALLAAINAGGGAAAAGETGGQTSQANSQGAESMLVTFSTPIRSGEPQIVGRSIEELIRSEPLFPPFEGIPDELWKGQHCTNCHQWTRDRICEQAQFYLGAEAARSLEKPHPLGLGFKQTLKAWAQAGCP
ncbi:MAG: caspase family protein [Rhodobacteraceae bacterium]|nr:caspase family protein [Paracoccaceae bacterium]